MGVTLPYNTDIGYTASTTGNITGIYDMAGGVNDVVMGYEIDDISSGSSEIASLYSDFFTNSNWNKYYDKYYGTDDYDFQKRILGDATGELGPFGTQMDLDGVSRKMGSWYSDWSDMTTVNLYWSVRGSSYYHGNRAGIFTFSCIDGSPNIYMTFRVVLTPQ